MTRPFLSLFIFLLAAQIAVSIGAAESAPLTASLLENDVLRVRDPHVMGNFSEEFFLAAPSSIATNKLACVILDLRSADGDKDGLASATNFFATKKYPLVILVNGQTRGAAAALAADLRTAGAGILVGSTNFAGPARPDITVSLVGADETNFLSNPFFIPAAPRPVFAIGTNEFMEFVDHTSEADLVRKRVKDGEADGTTSPRVEPAQPVIRDPALARALDLFKALAALHPARG